MDGAVKCAVPVVSHKLPSVVGLGDGEQIHVLNVGRYHHSPALADWSHRSDSYLLAHFRTDDGLGVVLVLGSIRVGDLGVELMSEELLDYRDGTVASIGCGSIRKFVLPRNIGRLRRGKGGSIGDADRQFPSLPPPYSPS